MRPDLLTSQALAQSKSITVGFKYENEPQYLGQVRQSARSRLRLPQTEVLLPDRLVFHGLHLTAPLLSDLY